MKCQEWTSRWEGTRWRPRVKAAGCLNKAPFSSISLLSHILGEAGREQCGKPAGHLKDYKKHCESFRVKLSSRTLLDFTARTSP